MNASANTGPSASSQARHQTGQDTRAKNGWDVIINDSNEDIIEIYKVIKLIKRPRKG
jgi:hypothetical protein